MAQSIRISDDLYALALSESRLMNRSLAQQLEHWAKTGMAFERSGANLDDIRSAAVAFRHTRDALDVKQGRRASHSLAVIPKAAIRRARLTFPADAFSDDKSAW